MKVLILLAASLTMKELPPAVRATVESQTKGAEIKSIAKETEDGRTQYEVETMVNGKHRDLAIDLKGNLIEIEDELAPGTAPAPVRAAAARKAAGGRIVTMESVTMGGVIAGYECEYIDKNGRKREARFKPDGSPMPD
ncbi:MAG TPA: hypothetical protein VHW09_24950 [Bryobacteraceae bacterium]|jgi:hypothetical protein|nr:hypothetical protein [Bryobacteraceae bacterium]